MSDGPPRPCVKRRTGMRATGNVPSWHWWQAFGFAEEIAQAFEQARTGGPDEAAAAVARARAATRDALRDAAENLGIPVDDPLMVETVAIALAAKHRMWNEPAPQPGRPRKDPQRIKFVGEFVDGVQRRNPSLSDEAVFRLPGFKATFRARFPKDDSGKPEDMTWHMVEDDLRDYRSMKVPTKRVAPPG